MGFSITISGGSLHGTLDLNDHVNYAIENYTPNIASRAMGLLGEDDPYGRVQEDRLTVNVYGSTKAAAMLNLKKLLSKVEQAQLWAAGEYRDTNPAVIFNYTPDEGGTVHKSAIFGSPENLDQFAALRPVYHEAIEAFIIPGVSIILERRGSWLGNEDSDNVTPSPSPEPIDITMSAALDYLSPTQVRVRFPHSQFALASSGFIVLTDAGAGVDNMELHSPGDTTYPSGTDTGFSQVSGGTSKRYSSNLLRFTAPDTAEYSQTLIANILPSHESAYLVFFAAVRNTNLTASFNISLQLDSKLDYLRGETVYIDKSTDQPRVVCLGTYPTGGKRIQPQYWNVQADTAGGILDVDYIFAAALGDGGGIIYLDPSPDVHSGACNPGSGITYAFDLVINPYQTEAPDPAVYAVSVCSGNDVYTKRYEVGYMGNAYFATKNSDMGIAILIPYGDHWVYVDDNATGDPKHNFNIEVIRQAATLSPG